MVLATPSLLAKTWGRMIFLKVFLEREEKEKRREAPKTSILLVQMFNIKWRSILKKLLLAAKKNITLPTGKTLEVKIPAGIESGKKLRFKGLGEAGVGKGAAGDAFIEITVAPLSGFIRRGRDIEVEVPISFIEAITGGEIKVPTLEGEILMTIAPGVSTGSKLRLRGKGVGVGDDRGNEIVVLKVVIPKEVDPALKAAVEKLKPQFNYNPRIQS